MSKRGRPFYYPLESVFWSLHSFTWHDHVQLPETQANIQETVAWLASYRQHDKERVLDVGSGMGNYALALADNGFDVIGIDFAPGMLKKARAKATQFPGASVEFKQADFNDDLPFPADSFDHTICIAALQCVLNPPHFLYEIKRVLKPDGLFLIVVGDSSQTAVPRKRLKTTLPRLVFWKLKALASKSRRVRKYTRNELIALLTSTEFGVVEERAYPATIAVMCQSLG